MQAKMFKLRVLLCVGFGAIALFGCSLFWTLANANEAIQPAHLILIGGGKRPPEALKSWVTGARKGTSTEKLGAIPWASGEPEETLKAFREEIKLWSASEVQAPPIAPGPNGFNRTELQQILSWIGSLDGLYFTGGDQNRVIDLFGRHPQMVELIRQRFEKGELVVAGTSAGTAIQGRMVFTGTEDLTLIDPDSLHLRPGLALLPEAIVDQHFVRRQRHNRMLSAVISSGPGELLGVAVDEDTALLIHFSSSTPGARAGKVVGRGQVILFNALNSGSPRKVELEIGAPGDCLKWQMGAGRSFDAGSIAECGDTGVTRIQNKN